MERYQLTDHDKRLIEIGLDVLKKNFDDGIYNHTVGCAVLCKNGNMYKGVNCDGIHGSCAEYITLEVLFLQEKESLKQLWQFTINI